MKVAWLALLLWVCVFFRSVGEAQENPAQQDLRDIAQRLEKEKKFLSKLRQRSTQILGSLGEVDREVEELAQAARQANENLFRHRKELESVKQEQERLENELARARRTLAARLREMYKHGDNWLLLLFGAQDAAEALQRIRWLQRRRRQDAEMLGRIEWLRAELRHEHNRLEQLAQAERQWLQEIGRRQVVLEQARQSRWEILQAIKKESALHRRTLVEMQQARESLSRVLAEMEGRAGTGKGFASWQGQLPPPVEGAKVEVPFGLIKDEDFGTRTPHPGIDLRAPTATPVRAVYPGQVAWADWFDGYGLLVILDHGSGYYTLYAHLEDMRVSRGEKVTAGTVLGRLGETGSIKGPYLYFEVRRGGQAVDPLKWIRLR